MVEGQCIVTLKSANLLANKVDKSIDPYIKIMIGKTHKWDSKTVRKGGLTPNFKGEYKRF